MNFLRRHQRTLIALIAVVILSTPFTGTLLAQETTTIVDESWISIAAKSAVSVGQAVVNPGAALADVGARYARTALEQLLFTFVINVFGLFVWFGASLLDAGIDYFVLGFGDTFLNSGMGVAVNNAWVIIRDFVNLFFIFGLVYIGFKMILDINSSNTRRMLVNLILAALLVNFSLFITKFVVDISNQLSSEIAVAGLGAKINPENGRYESNISEKFFQRMGISAILQSKPEGAGFGYIMGTAVLLLVTAFVFAAGGILLIIRFAVLCIFILFSPVMFMGWILSPLGDTMSKYWKSFIKRAFFAPIYLLFLYFSLQLIGGLQRSIGNTANTDLQNPNWQLTGNAAELAKSDVSGSGLGTLPFFVLICVFMIASLVVSSRLGAEGANYAIKTGQSLKRFAIKNTAGYATQGVGFASGKLNKAYNRYDARLQNMEGTRGDVLRGTRRALNVATLGATSDKALQSAFKAGKGARVMGSQTYDEADKSRDEKAARRNRDFKQFNNEEAIKDGFAAQREKSRVPDGMALVTRNGVEVQVPKGELSDAEKASWQEVAKKREDRIANMQRVVAEMNIKEFEALSDEKQTAIAAFISGSLAESVQKSDNISDKQKTTITDVQKKAIKDKISQKVGDTEVLLTEKLADLTIREIETLGDEFVTENAAFFTDGQFSDIKKSKKFTEGQVGRYIGKRKGDLVSQANTTPESVFMLKGVKPNKETGRPEVSYVKSKKVAEIAKLPGDALAAPMSARYITADVLKAIGSGDKEFERVSTSQRETIQENLQKTAADDTATTEQRSSAQKALNYLKSSKGQENFFGQEKPASASTQNYDVRQGETITEGGIIV